MPWETFQRYALGDATPDDEARRLARLEAHADESLRIANLSITPATRPLLLEGMSNVVWAAYGQDWRAKQRVYNALAHIRRFSPQVESVPPIAALAVSLTGLFNAWKAVEDELRAAEVPEDARDAILGHARKTTGRVYGVRGEALRRLHRAVCGIPVPAGVTVPF